MEGHAPVYVKVSEYEEVLAMVENIKKKVKESHDVLAKINELKAEEDKELLSWRESLDDITNRLTTLDRNLTGNQ